MTAVTAPAVAVRDDRFRFSDLWRVVKLLAVNPSVFFGVPWIILASAWAISVVIALIATGAGAPAAGIDGMRYSWAVLSPQWYLAVVGVQAVGLTFSFALGFGATRRDFWLGMSLMFVLVSAEMAIAIATLVQLEQATGGWWLGAHMFDALWFGIHGWGFDFFAAFSMQMLVLFIGASITTVFLRWRMRGMLILSISTAAILLAVIAALTFTASWPAVFTWLGSLGPYGAFALVLGFAFVFAVGGYFVIRRATPR